MFFVWWIAGVNSYALVPPPPHARASLRAKEEIDPDTHPRLKAYAKEATLKPIICSFGHRPSSASRTFHPATMKIRLKHGEIVKTSMSSSTSTAGGGDSSQDKVMRKSQSASAAGNLLLTACWTEKKCLVAHSILYLCRCMCFFCFFTSFVLFCLCVFFKKVIVCMLCALLCVIVCTCVSLYIRLCSSDD